MPQPCDPAWPSVIRRLWAAWNARDLEALAAGLHPDYASQQPLHPERNVPSRAEALRGWAALFESLPDFSAELCGWARQGEAIWTEWRWRGTLTGGGVYASGGVMIFKCVGERLISARIYTEVTQMTGPDWQAVLDEVLCP